MVPSGLVVVVVSSVEVVVGEAVVSSKGAAGRKSATAVSTSAMARGVCVRRYVVDVRKCMRLMYRPTYGSSSRFSWQHVIADSCSIWTAEARRTSTFTCILSSVITIKSPSVVRERLPTARSCEGGVVALYDSRFTSCPILMLSVSSLRGTVEISTAGTSYGRIG